jgi:hypothetical protein
MSQFALRRRKWWPSPRVTDRGLEHRTPYYDACAIPAHGNRKPSLEEYDTLWPRYESDNGRRGGRLPLGRVCH